LIEAQGLLALVEGVHLKDLQTRVKDVRRDVSKVYDLVERLEHLLEIKKCEE
jgi:hypothetical protein